MESDYSELSKYIESIKDFMKRKCDYAYLLNGKWGSGKTFFVENDLKNALANEKIKLIHVSLYGKKSFSQTNTESFLETLLNSNFPKKVCKIIVDFISKNNSNASMSIDLLIELSNFVLPIFKRSKLKNERYKFNFLYVFDDLERCDPDILVELLGDIYTQYIEKGCHVLFVGDESRLLNIHNYKEYKEKLIRNTLDFRYPNMASLISSIIAREKDSPIFNIYKKDPERMNVFFNLASNVVNVRTWLASFDYFNTLFAKSSFGEDFPYYPQLFCILFVTVYLMSVDVNIFNDTEKLNAVLSKEFHLSTGLVASLNSKETYKHPNDFSYIPLNPIVEYIKTGFCDGKAINDAMMSYFPVLSSEELALSKLYDDNTLTEKELENNLDCVCQGINKGKYSLYNLIRISRRFEYFNDIEYLKLYGAKYNDYEKVLNDAVEGISKENVADFFNTNLVHHSMYSDYKNSPNFLDEAIEKIRLKYCNTNEEKERFISVFTNLDKYTLEDIKYSGNKGTIEKASEYQLFETVLSYSSRAIALLNYYLTDISECDNSGDFYGSEIPYLEELNSFLNRKLPLIDFSKKKIDLKLLNMHIEKTIEKLKNTKRILK